MKNLTLNTALIDSPFQGVADIRSIYFIGIGGIGMSALARFFHSRGVAVSGYDKTSTTLTKELEASGIPIHYEEDLKSLPQQPDLVVYTPAIPAAHQELEFYRANGATVVKRSDVLKIISESSFNICIAGTHGKTTITTMVAHLLRDTGFGCNAFLGGIAVNYNTNFWSNPKNVCVIEADEYDRSFLKLSPDVAIVTAMDADHLDIYGDAAAVEQAFIDFSGKLKPGGMLVKQFGLSRGSELKAENEFTYSLQNEAADIHAANIKMQHGGYEFDVLMPGNMITGVTLNMGGMHNVENVLAAIAVAAALGIDNEKIKAAVASFKGVKRRFEYIIRDARQVYIDDYAHHPEELRALISGARSLFSEMPCTIIFQPHLFTRTRDFVDGFAEVLDMADEVILLPIYPARELPIEGVTSEMIASRMKKAKTSILSKDEVMTWAAANYARTERKRARPERGEAAVEGKETDQGSMNTRLLITAGAGDIDTLVGKIKRILEQA